MTNIYKVFLNGLITGLVLQLAVGPVFFFILNIALQRTILDGLSAVFAVTLVDYIYIILAILGVGKLLEKENIKNIFGIAGSVVLILFGVFMILSVKNQVVHNAASFTNSSDYFTSFISAFLLTISSPLTIVFWTSMFAAKAVETGYTKRQLTIFGLSAGMATLIFLGSSVVIFSFVRKSIPVVAINVLNVLVGVLLVVYGIIRLVNVFRNYNSTRLEQTE